MTDFQRLRVWQLAHGLTIELYRLTETFPESERYGLTAQTRRAAGSIGANIAESTGRAGFRDRNRLLRFALGSAYELENHIALAQSVGLLDEETAQRSIDSSRSIQKMLCALIGPEK